MTFLRTQLRKKTMTGQQLLQRMINCRAIMDQIIKAGMEQRFVDMQRPMPREVCHDFEVFSEAFQDLQLHCDKVDTHDGARWINIQLDSTSERTNL